MMERWCCRGRSRTQPRQLPGMAIGLEWARHASDDLPTFIRFEPGVGNARTEGCLFAVGPSEGGLYRILGNPHIARHSNRFGEEFVIEGSLPLKLAMHRLAERRLSDWHLLVLRPAEKLFVPKRHVMRLIESLHIAPVRFLHLPDFFLLGRHLLRKKRQCKGNRKYRKNQSAFHEIS